MRRKIHLLRTARGCIMKYVKELNRIIQEPEFYPNVDIEAAKDSVVEAMRARNYIEIAIKKCEFK